MKINKEITNIPAVTLSRLFPEFFGTERIGGLLLISFTILTLLLANSSACSGYISLWDTKIY
jgi:NhaA family Na+:H+ antiporter